MAVKCRVEVTLYKVIDIDKVTRYYLLQSSTLAAPSKPADGAAISSKWSKTEPSYTSGSTMTLYFVDQTVMSDGELKYSEVSKSSSYEAAKEAYNKAVAAAKTANNVQSAMDALNIGGRNLLIDSSFNNGYQSYIDDAYQINNNHTLKLYVNNTDTSGTKYHGIIETYANKRLSVPIADCLNKDLVLSAWLYIPEAGSVSGYEFRVVYTDNGTVKLGNPNNNYPKNLPSAASLSVGWNRLYAVYTISGDSTRVEASINVNAGPGKTSLAYLSSPKLEFGTRPTDWTPAPEDIKTRIDDAYTEIESNKTEISLKASQSEVATISSNLNAYIDSSTTMIQNVNGWQFNFNKLIRTDEADVANHTDYITLQNGDIILGESGSDLKLKIGNDAIQFKGTSDEEVTPDPDATAWITGQKFNINEGEIHTALKVGSLQFIPRPNGNFSLTIV